MIFDMIQPKLINHCGTVVTYNTLPTISGITQIPLLLRQRRRLPSPTPTRMQHSCNKTHPPTSIKMNQTKCERCIRCNNENRRTHQFMYKNHPTILYIRSFIFSRSTSYNYTRNKWHERTHTQSIRTHLQICVYIQEYLASRIFRALPIMFWDTKPITLSFWLTIIYCISNASLM